MRRVEAALAAAAVLAGAAWTGAQDAPDLETAVSAWLASLDPGQRKAASYAFDDDERFDLRLAPIGLEGLSGEDMSEAQWDAWLDALGTRLSPLGRRKVELIMSLEREMARVDAEGGFWRRWFGGFFRGERRYFASVYGDTGAGTPWGLRFDGHHLSLNWTRVPRSGESLTPLFVGAHPREVPEGWERQGLRALSEEEDRGWVVWNALDPAQRAAAELPFAYARGLGGGDRALFLGEGARVDPGAPRGVSYRDLDFEARRAVDALIGTYLGWFERDHVRAQEAAIDAAGREALHFAWAGSLEPGSPGYYRVHGPGLLIEFDNTAREADHVHAIYRDLVGDFGRDLLDEHYSRHHGPRFARRE